VDGVRTRPGRAPARPLGVAYERSVGFYKDFHAHDRPMILLPRGACVVKVRTAGERTETHTISSATALIVPSRVAHEDQTMSSIFDTLALFPSPSLVASVATDEGLTRATPEKEIRPEPVARAGSPRSTSSRA
jgi:uncharacterized protein YjlB